MQVFITESQVDSIQFQPGLVQDRHELFYSVLLKVLRIIHVDIVDTIDRPDQV